VKPLAPCRKIIGNVKKNTMKCEQICFEGKIHHLLCHVPPDLLLDGSASRIARECSGGRIKFPQLISFYHCSPCSYINQGDEQ
jgi:hypothetical protein